MPALSLAPSGDRFLRAEAPMFLLADTLWAAFTRPTMPEWRACLARRRRQGFTGVLISVLPIGHDRSAADGDRAPFRTDASGRWDLSAPDEGYFRHAREMVEAVVAEGLTPLLVLQWCNYVPETWAAQRTPELVMDDAQTRDYVKLALDTFTALDPVYVVSGDDRFATPAATQRYLDILSQVRAAAPGCLTTLHSSPSAQLPQALADSPHLDFYSYQSGHDGDHVARTGQLADQYRGQHVQRPIANLEPCYEGHGYGSGTGRHTAHSVRHASWASVLAGAGAGLGYGAHGVWSWHRPGDSFNGEHFSGRPFPAEVAVEFDGAWDVGLLRRLVEEHELYGLQPRPDLVVDDRSGACVGATEDLSLVAVYRPHPFPVTLAADLSGHDVVTWDLAHRRRDSVRRARREGGHTVLDQPDFLGDSVQIFRAGS